MRLYLQLYEAIQVFLAGWPNLQTPRGETVRPVHIYKLFYLFSNDPLSKDKMIVKLEGKLERGFAPWKAMVEGASDTLKEHGMTIIFAGTSAADDNSMTVIIDFASSEGMMNFANDEEATTARAETGVLLDTVVMTPMTDESVTNFSG